MRNQNQEIEMVKLGLVTLDLMLMDLKTPRFAGDLPVQLDFKAGYDKDTTYGGDEYDDETTNPGDCSGGCDCGGDCQHGMEMAPGPAFIDDIFEGPFDDPTGDRDRTRDRIPRPDRKRLPWEINIAS